MKDILDKNYIKIGKGIILSWMITFILLLIYALLLTYTKIGENTMVPVIIFITFVSILARKFYWSRSNSEKRYAEWKLGRTDLYLNNLFIIKPNGKRIYFKFIFYYHDHCSNRLWSNWWGSRSEFEIID